MLYTKCCQFAIARFGWRIFHHLCIFLMTMKKFALALTGGKLRGNSVIQKYISYVVTIILICAMPYSTGLHRSATPSLQFIKTAESFSGSNAFFSDKNCCDQSIREETAHTATSAHLHTLGTKHGHIHTDTFKL